MGKIISKQVILFFSYMSPIWPKRCVYSILSSSHIILSRCHWIQYPSFSSPCKPWGWLWVSWAWVCKITITHFIFVNTSISCLYVCFFQISDLNSGDSGTPSTQVFNLLIGNLYNQFTEKEIDTFDDFHQAFMDVFA